MNRRLFVVFASALLMLATIAPVAAAPAGGAGSKAFTKAGNYIVQLAEWPVVAYDGSISGYKATKPRPGSKIDPQSADVSKYASYLISRHDAMLRSAGATKKLYSYTYSYNGFAARLSAAQANKLAVSKGVVAISLDKMYNVDTSSTPTFLGLDAEGGLWDQLGGTGKAGEGIIIGVVDSGIWPESLSFADRVNANGVPSTKGSKVFQQIPGWHGKCSPGENFTATNCNQKLIGARYFNAGFGGNAGINADRPWEFTSPRDYNGHGTHTSSTSGGNHGVPTTGDAAVFGAVSGMAPRARVAMYKALWSNESASTASGFGIDLVAAIDQAVADGVDVINYSISGSSTNFLDAAEVSFLFAAAAGVFVSASAGNSGPTASTVAHPSPWTTTVAAGTHNRSGVTTITLGNGAVYNGASLTNGVGPAPIIHANNAGLPGADANELRQCFSDDGEGNPVLDPAKVGGKIVICERGGTAPANGRVDKSAAVQAAGGVGIVVANVVAGASINADLHSIPAIHVNSADGAAITTYAAGVSPTATIAPATVVLNAPAPFTAGFSSRGPLLAGGGDILKPDVIAPGQDILAAVAPPGNHGKDFDIYSGTSMSAPHVAGIAALLKDAHPSWSPAAIKSALMTSAYDVLDAGSTDSRIFSQGAGHIEPNSATNPGLVFDAGLNDWRNFLKGQGLCNFCFGATPATAIDASDLNSASIAIGALAGNQTVTRSVKSVGSASETYTFSKSGLTGIDVSTSDSSFTIGSGASKSFTVSFTTNGAALNSYVGGFLTWTGNHGHVVRIPVVVKPVALSAPAQVSGTGAAINYDVTFGYTGPFSATARGLIPAVLTAGTVLDDPTDSTCSLSSPNARIHEVTVPGGTTYARFSLFDAFTDGDDDLDLCVFNAAGDLVGTSGSATSAEEVNLLDPAAGTYRVVVQGWGTDGPDAQYTLFSWVLGTAAAGNMAVTAPASATLGATGTIGLTFTGLSPATKYLGSVAYAGIAGLPNPTIVRVDTP